MSLIYFIANVENEFNNQYDQINYQLKFIKKLGINKTIHALIPQHRAQVADDLPEPYTLADLPADVHGRHLQANFQKQLRQLIAPATKPSLMKA